MESAKDWKYLVGTWQEVVSLNEFARILRDNIYEIKRAVEKKEP